MCVSHLSDFIYSVESEVIAVLYPSFSARTNIRKDARTYARTHARTHARTCTHAHRHAAPRVHAKHAHTYGSSQRVCEGTGQVGSAGGVTQRLCDSVRLWVAVAYSTLFIMNCKIGES